MNKFLKILFIIICWLTLSPVMLVLSNRWSMMPKWLRIILMLVSPLFLAFYLALAIGGEYWYYQVYFRKHHFVKPSVIENITGVKMPKYKVIDYQEGKMHFTGDYGDSFFLKFNKMPSDEFYKELEKHFDKDGDSYSYDVIWGNGFDAPKGESEYDDYSFSIYIEKDIQYFTINVSRW